MSNREVMQQALETLQYGKPNKAITILREALEQPEQEPWRESASDYERGVIDGRQMQAQSSVDKAVNAMTQRPWQGLTPEEVLDLFDVNNVYGSKWIEFARTVEAKLKDKNT